MDSFELNKIAGAILATLLVIMGTNKIASGLFQDHSPEKPGYAVEIAINQNAQTQTQEESEIPIGDRLALADVKSGMKQAKKCLTCHLVNENAGNKLGPNLYGIIGRAVASITDFKYSNAIKNKTPEIEQWGYHQLDQFLKKPKKYIPKTSMVFAGIKNPQKRADLILYLKSISPNAPPIQE